MKKIAALIQDETTLILQSDAQKGDYIDLKDLQQVDLDFIKKRIDEGRDQEYLRRLKSVEETEKIKLEGKLMEANSKSNETISALQNQIDQLIKQKENEVKILKLQLEQGYQQEINNLKKDIEALKEKEETNKRLALQELEQNYFKTISDYKDKINELEKKLLQEKTFIENEKRDEIEKLKDSYKSLLAEKDEELRKLQYSKSIRNVKQTGEDLEAWCNNEVLAYMQNGLKCCSWIKDNDVVLDESDSRGTKADFIFRVYSSEDKTVASEIASVCLEMKDENPSSTHHKKNSDYYKALDKNRAKKKCKYALLVSNLELDKPNLLPLYKVMEFEDMYVVRPEYMMTFLNIITSLSQRYSDLINAAEEKKAQFLSSVELLQKFEDLKKTYLDKPLQLLENKISSILKSSQSIIKSANEINDYCDSITRQYIKEIEEKLNKFNIEKQIKALDKISL